MVTAELAATLKSVLAFVPEGPSTSRAGLYTARGSLREYTYTGRRQGL